MKMVSNDIAKYRPDPILPNYSTNYLVKSSILYYPIKIVSSTKNRHASFKRLILAMNKVRIGVLKIFDKLEQNLFDTTLELNIIIT